MTESVSDLNLAASSVPTLNVRSLLGVLTQMRSMQDVLELVDEPEAIDDLDKSRKLRDKAFPYSCTDEEGLALYHVISSNGLANGFEVATAFGYSTAFMGLAAKRNGGKLVTLDCYVEEWKESFNYEPAELEQAIEATTAAIKEGRYPSGLATADGCLAALGLRETVILTLGVSPQHVGRAVGDLPLDFVLIDGGHFGDQPRWDFEAVAPNLADRCAVFFHDNNGNQAVERAVAAAEEALGSTAVVLPTRYRLTLVGRWLDPATIDALSALFARAQ
ncbi:MAG: class I SAM-dependent methyltransferase [Solirubrobacteraceae bacterium]